MINSELLHRIADAIESETEARFKMDTWRSRSDHPCGTACCVAGFAVLLTSRDSMEFWTSDEEKIAYMARDVLGFSEAEARMFYTWETDGGTGVVRGVVLSYHTLNGHFRPYVPDALRWMADKKTISWTKGLEAAISKAECVARHEREVAHADAV